MKLSSTQMRKTAQSQTGEEDQKFSVGHTWFEMSLRHPNREVSRKLRMYEFRVQDKCVAASINFRLIGIKIIFIRLGEITKKRA